MLFRSFADNARRLIKLPKFTMAEFRDMLQDSLAKQEAGMTYIQKARLKLDTMRGGSTEEMIESQKAKVQTHIDIINQMTPCEVDRPALIGYRERERISQALGLEIDRGGSRTPMGELLEQQDDGDAAAVDHPRGAAGARGAHLQRGGEDTHGQLPDQMVQIGRAHV